jgi:hypothetical protein
MICWHCDKPISGKAKTYEISAPNGPGATVHVHPKPCKRPPAPTHPVPGTGERRSRG